MNSNQVNQILLGSAVLAVAVFGYCTLFCETESPQRDFPVVMASATTDDVPAAAKKGVSLAVFNDSGDFSQADGVIRDSNIRLCQGYGCSTCGGNNGCSCGQSSGPVVHQGGVAAANYEAGYSPANRGNNNPVKRFAGVNEYTRGSGGGEPRWRDAQMVPWEAFAYGEYIGPHRAPHVSEYRLRVNDLLEFVYILTREKSTEPYRFYVGDQISIASAVDSSINVPTITVQTDGAVSLSLIGQVRIAGKTIADLQRELNDRYSKYFQDPSIVVQVIEGDTPLQDLLNSVDARAGAGGQSRSATVSPDGTIQLPLIGNVPAIGLSLNEIGREVNARYRMQVGGISVTPVLTTRAPRFVYVVGEVGTPGRFDLTGPTTAIQAIALAGGTTTGGNLRQIIVFRRDQNWRLTATKLDLAGALFGKKPFPSDEIWLRDSDIVLIPKSPILRFSEQINLYLAQTLYSIFPQQGVAFNFDNFTSL